MTRDSFYDVIFIKFFRLQLCCNRYYAISLKLNYSEIGVAHLNVVSGKGAPSWGASATYSR